MNDSQSLILLNDIKNEENNIEVYNYGLDVKKDKHKMLIRSSLEKLSLGSKTAKHKLRHDSNSSFILGAEGLKCFASLNWLFIKSV